VQDVAPGRTIGGRYTLNDRRLASADGVEVWNAADAARQAEVTLTLFPATAATSPAILDAARRAARVQDPRLVRILDVGTSGHLSWIVEEHHPGAVTLVDVVEDNPLGGEGARTVVGEAAAGLAAAAESGMHHQRLTPYSVLVTRSGEVKVSGLGTVLALEGGSAPPPDRAERLDTLGLLALGYYALTTRWPLPTEVPGILPAPRLAGGVPAPSEIVAGVPADFDALCRTALNGRSGPARPAELVEALGSWRPSLHESPDRVEAGWPEAGTHRPDAADLPLLPLAGAPLAPAPAAATESEPLASEPVEPPAEAPAEPPVEATAEETDRRTLAALATGSAAGAATAAGEVVGRLGTFARSAAGRAQIAGDELRARVRAERAERELADQHAVRLADIPHETDPEPPGPLMRMLDPDEKPGTHSRVVLAAVAGFVAVALLIASFVVIRGFGRTGDQVAAAATATTSAASPASGSAGTPGATAGTPSGPGAPVAITAGTSIDPVGRDGENDNQIPRTFDGNPATRWQSENYYADPRWEAGPNRSVGLAFRLTQPTTLRAVQLTFPASPGQSGVIYVADEPAIAGATKAGEFSDATGSTEVALTGAPQASYVIVMFTKAPRDGGGYRASLNEIVPLG